MTAPKLVFVVWLDAETDTGWIATDEAMAGSHPRICNTVGWLIHQDDKRIVVAQTYSDDEINGHIVIPASWIEGDIVVIEQPSNVVPLTEKK